MAYSVLHHTFPVEIAEKYGVDAAILIHHFAHWIAYNKRENKNFHDGTWWMYDTRERIALHFPYWSEKEVRLRIEKLVELKILKTGNFNKIKFDKTLWYAFCEPEKFLGGLNSNSFYESPNGQIETPEQANRKAQTGTPIPHTKPHTKEHIEDSPPPPPYANKFASGGTPSSEVSEKKPPPREAFELAEELKKFIESAIEKKISPNMKIWAKDMDLLLRKDGHTIQEIQAVMAWVFADNFWRCNILSPRKLREKFLQLLLKSREKKNGSPAPQKLKTAEEWKEVFNSDWWPAILELEKNDSPDAQLWFKQMSENEKKAYEAWKLKQPS
jgi:hypothetical protein